ncbi:phage holin family protein [Paenibacillus macerans]|uniref:phage holin family protein n=1 Tax=Paenibacillus macerans TaxID=44252 RepID=UPI00203B8AE3|nr:phage holin family protein [Paenibacillus macerans]MCM3701414.1 phage holin family protein [Paenibacillus macerans]
MDLTEVWAIVSSYINPELLIVVAVCWIIGFVLKQTPRVPDWTIIYGVTLVAVVFAGLLLGFTAQSVLQGILCGAVAVYSNQLVKQAKKSGEDK